MEREFTAVVRNGRRWFVAYVDEVPAINTQGRTPAEARRNPKEPLRLVIETNGKFAAKEGAKGTGREPLRTEL